MKFTLKGYTLFLGLGLILFSCNNTKKEGQGKTLDFQNKGHELIYKMTQKVGDYTVLKSKKDVVYTYTYTTPDGKTDISTEKYIFDGELSYGEYKQHGRTLPQLEGTIEQCYDGETFWIKHNGEILEDSLALKRVAFSRPTNFYWFTMFQKLLDPGLKYEFLEEESLKSDKYDIVKVSFESINEKPTDIYQVYINRESGLVDQFLFTVADFGITDPKIMQIEYEKIEDVLIPTKRKYKKSNWDAEVDDSPWILVNWSDITFDNGLIKKDFKK